MPIDDPIAVKAIGELFRPAAERMLTALRLMRQIRAEWRATANDLGSRFPADAGPVADNREAEGITPVSAAQANAFVRLCDVIDAMAVDDTDPTTGEHTGVTSEDLLHVFAVRER